MMTMLMATALVATPDYRRREAWAARPGAEGAASTVAPGASPAARETAVDVFYVHPTTDRSRNRFNSDITDATVNGWTEASVIARQASAFNGCCRIFAPRYRQATSKVFTIGASERDAAFNLAYGDVERAFADYLAHDNRGRPFILAGHSQGASHLTRLIKEKIDGTPLGRRMVAAYVIGFNLSEGDFGKTYKSVSMCAKPDQTGCIVQWNAVLTAPPSAQRAAGEARYVARYGDDPRKRLLCVNPLTFDRARTSADRDSSKGAAPGDPGYGSLLPLMKHSVSARCEDGYLIVQPDPALDLKPLPGGSMHYHDIGLFYGDIRADTLRRIAAWRQRFKVAR